ncbi:MAG TPA: sulfate adenylyltransferase subunit CysD [Bryobacteraceae bacterium]
MLAQFALLTRRRPNRTTPLFLVYQHTRDCATLQVVSHWRHLQQLEAESIHIMREVVAECQRPVLLYSIGKDSSVLLRLAQKAFYPGPVPFPLLHIDTGYKFREMIEFRDRYTAELGLKLIVHTNHAALEEGANPFAWGTQRCCGALKTTSLLDGLREGGFDAAMGGARRDEERSRAKERVFSFRDTRGQWDPRNQRPELWNVFNTRIHPGESLRVFPLSNWTELDIWQYIYAENIPIVPLYFAKPRPMLVRGDSLLPVEQPFVRRLPGEQPQMIMCRMRSLGCSPCTGAIRSEADTLPKIIEELISVRRSERQNRVIDHDQDGSMEIKKQEGYF